MLNLDRWAQKVFWASLLCRLLLSRSTYKPPQITKIEEIQHDIFILRIHLCGLEMFVFFNYSAASDCKQQQFSLEAKPRIALQTYNLCRSISFNSWKVCERVLRASFNRTHSSLSGHCCSRAILWHTHGLYYSSHIRRCSEETLFRDARWMRNTLTILLHDIIKKMLNENWSNSHSEHRQLLFGTETRH